MTGTAHAFSVTVNRERRLADNIQPFSPQDMNPAEIGMLSRKSSRKKEQDLSFCQISRDAEVQKTVVVSGIGTELYASALIFLYHACNEKISGDGEGLLLIQPDADRTGIVAKQQSQCNGCVGEFAKMQPVEKLFQR